MLPEEYRDSLQGFSKRMLAFNLTKYIFQRKRPDDIKEIFNNDDDIADNLIVATITVIMDKCLCKGKPCTKQDVRDFIYEAAGEFGYDTENVDRLTDYIITTVLQNDGKVCTFKVYDPEQGEFTEQIVRIITEKNSTYELTPDMYTFMFQTKEIQDEYDFSITRFKLQQYIKRGNYSQAMYQSRDLLSKTRALKAKIEDFMLRVRTNIKVVMVNELDSIVSQTCEGLEKEKEELENIRALATDKQSKSVEYNGQEEDIKKKGKEIQEILSNIDAVILEQGELFNLKYAAVNLYKEALNDRFGFIPLQRFDFEKELIYPMQQASLGTAANLKKLFIPLFKPSLSRIFTLDFFYRAQKRIKEATVANGIDMSGGIVEDTLRKERNARYVAIMEKLLRYAHYRHEQGHPTFCFSEYIESLTKEELDEQMTERALITTILDLYSIVHSQTDKNTHEHSHRLEIAPYRNGEYLTVEPLGDFDITYCFVNIPRELLQMETLEIELTDKEFDILDKDGTRHIITDVLIEVKK